MDNSSSPEPDRLPEAAPQQPARTPAARPFAEPGDAELRASDADREQVAAALRDAYAEGRLDAEEHAQRLDAAYAAKTLGELVPLTRDLPAHDRVQPKHAPAPAEERAPVPSSGANDIVAIFGGSVRKGRFRAGRFMRAKAIFGGIEIDLTDAVFDAPELVIEVNAVFGGVEVKVPDHVSLHGGGAGIFGGFDVREEEGTDPDGPVVTIRGRAVFGGVEARHRRSRRAESRNEQRRLEG